jgi:uncharacterized protein (TIGR03083 family)
MIDVTSALAPERTALLELLRSLSTNDWGRPTECPAWTVHQLALHILGDDLSLLARQRDASPTGLIQYAESHPGLTFMQLLDGFNEQWVTASTFVSPRLLLAFLELVGEWSDEFYGTVGLETVSREPVGFFAQSEPSPYWQLIAREYAERVIHQSQIRRAIGAPELDGAMLEWMAVVVVHALSHWLIDYQVRDGSTIGVDLGEVGSWAWTRGPDDWSVVEGVDAPDASVIVAPDQTVAVLTRGLSLTEANAAITVKGDEALGRGALEIFAPFLGKP